MNRNKKGWSILTELLGVISICALDGEDEESSTLDEFDVDHSIYADMDDLVDLYSLVASRQYLSDREMAPKRKNFSIYALFHLPDDNFRQITRISKAAFVFGFSEIKQHSVFHNESDNEQVEVWLQIAFAWGRFGNYGNGAS
ncbi:hypothetical protein DVH05_017712 [Phytophthora capsici]|nr:hypothetical protein DVH05_017712 [Phytophthora capsici]